MELTTILTTILKVFATSPDLCGDVYVDDDGNPYVDALGQTLSRYCEWTGPDAPTLDSDVCCAIEGDTAACVLPDSNGRCSIGSMMYCKYGEVTELGAVCYQPFPSVCDLGYCDTGVLPPDLGPIEDALCCWPGGSCTEVETGAQGLECVAGAGTVGFCMDGVQNEDGTIECFD